MRYAISHRTRYLYGSPVLLSQHAARLTPRAQLGQRCLSSRLTIEPRPTSVEVTNDYFGNSVSMFSVQGAHKALVVTAESEVEVTTRPVLEDGNPVLWPDLRTRLANPGASDLAAAEFIHASPLVPLLDDLAEYARTSFPPGRRLLAGVRDLTARIHADFIYDATATSVSTPLAEVWAMRRGVCQDFAHLEIGCLRSLGLAARYVSGYLMSRPPPGKPRLVGADASHAWMSVWTPTAGWVDFDPTNDMVVGEDHITCAVGRDFDDVSPLKGSVVGGGEHSVHVAVDVVPKGLSPAAASSPVMSL